MKQNNPTSPKHFTGKLADSKYLYGRNFRRTKYKGEFKSFAKVIKHN